MGKLSFGKIEKIRSFLPAICLLLILLVNLVKTPDFFDVSLTNGVFYGFIIDVINRGSELAIIAVGMTLVVSVSGGVDISVGSVAALTAAVITNILSGGEVSVNTLHAPIVLAMAAGLASAFICGVWNGFLVAHLKIQPMVATLILYTAGRGIAQLICGGQITYIRVDAYRALGSNIGNNPVPTPIYLAAAVMILTAIFLRFTSFGLYARAVGMNAEAARLSGLNPRSIKFLTYIISAVLAGLAGAIYSSRIYSCDANNIGLNVEMDAILAVLLGGNKLKGGKFSISGSVIGAYTIQALTTSLYAMGVSSVQIPLSKAAVILIALSLQSPEIEKIFRKVRKTGASPLVKEAAQL
ncbi:MAG: ABC transporter permease [Lachnospiraceae bacterium]|nr:ABC transporter permease [Lachnospiraceae bacterium]